MTNSTRSPGHSPTKGRYDDLKRHSRLSLSLDQQDRANLTPPPNEVPASRSSSRASANVTLNKAFASDEEQSTFFPPSFYRDRTPSRPRTKGSPVRTTESPMQRGSDNLAVAEPRDRDRSYSPMAAAFARLNVREGPGSPPSKPIDYRGRSESGRSSVDLGAKMFGGSA